MSSVSLESRVLSSLTPNGEIDLGELFPPLRKYCPLYWLNPGITPKQALYLLLDVPEAFYGGAAGGGKSAALLMGALQYVDVPGYHALILRRTFKQLTKGDALIPLSHEWLSNTDARWNAQDHKWTFPSGATVEFGHVEHEDSKYDYQGAAYHYMGFDELSQFSESAYEYIAFSRQRRRTDMAAMGIPVRTRATSNPGGIGHGWVKRRFLTERSEDVVFIFAKLRDNPGLDADDYEKRLLKLSPALASQLLDGNWDAFEGMAYETFSRDLHGVPAFQLPDSFMRWEAMDHGTDNPTAWLLIAQDYDGNRIVCDEYYSPGLPDVHCAEILRRRKLWWEAKDDKGYILRHTAYGDPSIRIGLPIRDDFGQQKTTQDIYQEHGVRIIPGNNKRAPGFIEIALSLKPNPDRIFPLWHARAGQPGCPSLFIVTSACPHLTEQLENAPLASGEADPLRGEAVDGRWEGEYGHAHAALRYGLLGRALTSSEPDPEPEDPRQALALRLGKRLKDLDSQKDLVDL